jgi:hypothetical protein
VDVYRNLHLDGVLWSVRKTGGKVLMHAQSVYLIDVEFIVHESGRQRVLKEKKKNVHAFARGTLVLDHMQFVGRKMLSDHSATYNPYKYNSFMYKDDEIMLPLFESSMCHLESTETVSQREIPKVTVWGAK